MDLVEQQCLGFEWVKTNLTVEPRWTADVDIGSIETEVKSALGVKSCQATFFAQGAFNKLFLIQTDGSVLMMRIGLPVDPGCKTASEVSTTEWIRHHTRLPVPEILAHKGSQDNAIGYEWILMMKLPGKPMSSAWRSISLEVKTAIVRRLVGFCSALFENQRRGIGNLYSFDSSTSSRAPDPDKLGKLVSLEFLWANRLRYGISRGPFESSRDWFAARLSLLETECRTVISNEETDEDDLDDAERTLGIVEKLQKSVITIFPDAKQSAEPSMLHHDDLSQHNILVNTDGTLSGVVDWECVSWVPLWKACYYPMFLQSRPRESKPDRDRYQQSAEGEADELYWDHLMEYELTYLRREFIDAMRRVQPGWVRIFEKCTMERNFDYAVSNCDNEFLARDIEEWIEAIGRKSIPPFDLRDHEQAY